MTSVRCKIRHNRSNHNADRKDLFSDQCGPAYLKQVKLSDAERFVIKQLWSEYDNHSARLLADKEDQGVYSQGPEARSRSSQDHQDGPRCGNRDR